MTGVSALASSFRDPSGFVFESDGVIYRQINQSYREDYDLLLSSGLYAHLAAAGQIIPHVDVTDRGLGDGTAYRVIQPDRLAFVSYPYEWCFSQLKQAARTTLAIQKAALAHGMSLKDGSAYNIQFVGGKPLLIDTLSFERHVEGRPWVAYRQFCQHFLAPLALMSLRDVRLGQLLRIHLDGIPLDLASALLPFRSRLRFSLLAHIHLHARSQKRYAHRAVSKQRPVSRRSLHGLLDSLDTAVAKLRWRPAGTEWSDYYEATNYSDESFRRKEQLVAEYVAAAAPARLWDLGGNLGHFSRIAASQGIETVSFDVDPASVEKNYLICRDEGAATCLPLLLDLTNPSPGSGWQNRERMSLLRRGPVDCALALALVHHLAISNNLPFAKIADFFAQVCRHLVIEFVPKHDSQVERLLRTREDIFDHYAQGPFEAEFGKCFTVLRSSRVGDSARTLYLMQRK